MLKFAAACVMNVTTISNICNIFGEISQHL